MSRSSDNALAVHRTTTRLGKTSARDLAAIAAMAFTQLEEEFFRVGDALSRAHDQRAEPHDFSDLDVGYQRKTIWRVVVGWLRGDRA